MRLRVPVPMLTARGKRHGLLRLSAVAVLIACLVTLRAGPAAAQATGFVPYFGKNNPHYDRFAWRIYNTDHFEIYYYPEIEKHLARVASYAESAYQQISADLRHELPSGSKVQLILFKTHSEFEQENVDPYAAQEGVGAFAEPVRQRMVMPIDDPPDQLYGLIVHELTHQFQFDIIPQGLIRRNVPLWVNEGGADYERGQWSASDLMEVRDAAVADIVPKMSKMEGYGDTGNALLVYNLGHAVYEFIEAKFGKQGIRDFLFALRKSVIGGGEDAYEEAFKMKKDEFDQAFERYLKDRFKPFRDKERPADYGRDLSPNKEKTEFAEALSIAPSPSGDLIAAVTINRKDREIDIVLLSAKDGTIVRNLTSGFDKNMGFDHIVLRGERTNIMPYMSWSPKGDRLAYFVRTEKERTLVVQNVLTKQIEERIPLKSVDEPESPSFAPDGRTIAFAALRGAIGDIYTVDLQTKEVVNLTNDDFADYGPTYSPDGKMHRLQRAGERQSEAVQARPRHQDQDPAHLRHGGRNVGAVHRRSHPRVLLDRNRPRHLDRAGGGEERQHLQHLDAGHDDRRDAAIHRRARRQLVGRGPERGQDEPDRVHQLLQERIRDSHARAQGAAAHGVDVGFRRAWTDHRFPAAARAHAGRGKRPQEGHVREDVSRGPAAAERRRHQQR